MDMHDNITVKYVIFAPVLFPSFYSIARSEFHKEQ